MCSGHSPVPGDAGCSDDAAKLKFASAALQSGTAVFEKTVDMDEDLVASLRWMGGRSAAEVRLAIVSWLAFHCAFLHVCR